MTFSQGIPFNKRKKKIDFLKKHQQFIFGYHRNKIETAHFLSKDDELLEVNVNITGLNTVLVQSMYTYTHHRI